jgi:hypothetical protein
VPNFRAFNRIFPNYTFSSPNPHFISDTNALWDNDFGGHFAENEPLFLNAIQYCIDSFNR